MLQRGPFGTEAISFMVGTILMYHYYHYDTLELKVTTDKREHIC